LRKRGAPVNKRLHRIPDPDEAATPPLSPELQARSRRAAELLHEWMAVRDGYDEEIWPLLEEELADSRTRIGSAG
jgi:hypothetical protein